MAKPKKPYPTFPLTPHNRGGWAKSYKGNYLYITPADPNEALAEFHRRARAIDSGLEPKRKKKSHWTAGELGNAFTRSKRLDHEGGKLSSETLSDYRAICKEAIRVLGRDTLVADLEPGDFARLFRHWQKRLKDHAMARSVQGVRTMFRWGAENGLIPVVAFGTTFRKPQVGKKSGKPFTTEELRTVLEHSEGVMRAFILTCANCAYTARDCALLPASALDVEAGVLRFPRPKMLGRRPIDRACTLWPETLTSLKGLGSDGLLFRGERGASFRSDVACHRFKDLCKEAGVDSRGPAWIRHWFRTVADELERPHAVCRIMGHRLPGMAEVYVDAVEHGRLQAVTDHVRKALIRLEPSPGDDWVI